MKTEKVNLNRLWNIEFPLLVERNLNIIQKHNPEALHIGVRFNAANAFAPLLKQIIKQERASKFSAAISTKDDERDSGVGCILTVSTAFARLPDDEHSDAGARISALLKKYEVSATANYLAETQQLRHFCAEVDASAELQADIASLSLTSVYDRMKAANEEFEHLIGERGVEQGSKPQIDIRSIRRQCAKAMTALWEAIDLAVTDYPEVDYTPLIGELNAINGDIAKQLKARDTRRKNGAKTEEEQPIEVKI